MRERPATISFMMMVSLALFPAGLRGQYYFSTSSECSQPAKEQDALIREAERDHYTTGRVEFIGNENTSDTVLRHKTNIGLEEGELFTRRNLIRSLRNVSTLKVIYPVRVADVKLKLNPSEKTVDMSICFKERNKGSEQRANSYPPQTAKTHCLTFFTTELQYDSST
jgi:outer membrane protein assembly factor BamA